MKAMNLERENFGFLNVFYVEDNPVMGYDNKGLVPDWCKCEKWRRRWRRECESICRGTIPDSTYACNIVCSAALGGILGGILPKGVLSGAIVDGGSVVVCVLLCGSAPKDENIWCPYRCRLEERRICEPEIPYFFPGLGLGWGSGPIYIH